MDMKTNEDYRLPSAEAILAGTLALMTGHAQSRCEAQRHCMARKIGTNLCKLAEHPDLSQQFRMVLSNLRNHWQILMDQGQAASSARQDPRLLHASPSTIH